MKEEKTINFESKYIKHFDFLLYIGVSAISIFVGDYLANAINKFLLGLPIPNFSFFGYHSPVSDPVVFLFFLWSAFYLDQKRKRTNYLSPLFLLLFLPVCFLIGVVTALLHIH